MPVAVCALNSSVENSTFFRGKNMFSCCQEACRSGILFQSMYSHLIPIAETEKDKVNTKTEEVSS